MMSIIIRNKNGSFAKISIINLILVANILYIPSNYLYNYLYEGQILPWFVPHGAERCLSSCSTALFLTHFCQPLRSTFAVKTNRLRDDCALRALSSLGGLRGAPAVPPLCRETRSLAQQMLNATVGINGLNRVGKGKSCVRSEIFSKSY